MYLFEVTTHSSSWYLQRLLNRIMPNTCDDFGGSVKTKVLLYDLCEVLISCMSLSVCLSCVINVFSLVGKDLLVEKKLLSNFKKVAEKYVFFSEH